MATPSTLSLKRLNLDPKTRALARFIIQHDFSGDEAEFLKGCCNHPCNASMSAGAKDYVTRAVTHYLDRYAETLEVIGFPMPKLPLRGPEISFDADAWALLHREGYEERPDAIREHLAQEINGCFNESLKTCNTEEEIYKSVVDLLNKVAYDVHYFDYDPFATTVREIAWQEIKSRFRVGPVE